MTVRNARENDQELSFFRYDWALSRYRWIDENCCDTVSGFGNVENFVHPSSDVKISFRRHISQEGLNTHVTKSKKGKLVTRSQSLCTLQLKNEAQELFTERKEYSDSTFTKNNKIWS